MIRCRTSLRTGAALVLLLALAACSSDDPDDAPAADRASESRSTSGQETGASSSPSGGTSTPDGATAAPPIPEGPGGGETGWVLADQLDTKAPVDATSLPDGVTVEQVADARKAWNSRDEQLQQASDACDVVGEVWIAVVGEGDARRVTIGAQHGRRAACSDSPLMTVDAATNAVVGGAEFAALL